MAIKTPAGEANKQLERFWKMDKLKIFEQSASERWFNQLRLLQFNTRQTKNNKSNKLNSNNLKSNRILLQLEPILPRTD